MVALLMISSFSFGETPLVIGREEALNRVLYDNGLMETLEKQLETYLRNIRPLMNAASAQRGFQEDYYSYYNLLVMLEEPIPEDFHLTLEEQFDQFYRMRIEEQPLISEYEQMKLGLLDQPNQIKAQIDALLPLVLSTQEQYEMALEDLSLFKREHDLMKEAFEAGTLSKNDFKRHALELKILEENVSLMKSQHDTAALNMKMLLGLAYDDEVLWVNSYRATGIKPLEPVTDYVQKALNERIDLKQLEVKLKHDKLTFALYREIHFNLHERAGARLTVTRTEEAIRVKKRDIEKEVRTAYESVNIARNKYEASSNRYKVMKADLSVFKKEWQLGQMTEVAYDRKAYELSVQRAKTMTLYTDLVLAIEHLKAVGGIE